MTFTDRIATGERPVPRTVTNEHGTYVLRPTGRDGNQQWWNAYDFCQWAFTQLEKNEKLMWERTDTKGKCTWNLKVLKDECLGCSFDPQFIALNLTQSRNGKVAFSHKTWIISRDFASIEVEFPMKEGKYFCMWIEMYRNQNVGITHPLNRVCKEVSEFLGVNPWETVTPLWK